MRKLRMIKQLLGFAAVVGLSAFVGGRAEAGFVLTANAAGSQASTVSGVTTESFDSFSAGGYTSLNTAVGSLSSPGLQIVNHDQYGGAGGTNEYFSIGAQSGQTTATLTLNGSQAYFGFWWSAADSLNQIQFLSGGQVVGSFNASTALNALDSTYNGNPNGGDSGEKFAYLNFIGTSGSTFDQVVFSNASTGTGFESDNWSVRAAQLSSPYPGTVITTSGVVPEPSSMILTASGLIGVVGIARRRRNS